MNQCLSIVGILPGSSPTHHLCEYTSTLSLSSPKRNHQMQTLKLMPGTRDECNEQENVKSSKTHGRSIISILDLYYFIVKIQELRPFLVKPPCHNIM